MNSTDISLFCADSFVLLAVRFTTLFALAPFWSARGVPRIAVVPLSLAVSVVVTLSTNLTCSPEPITTAGFLTGVLGEVLIGLVIGLWVRLAFEIFHVIGNLVAVSSLTPMFAKTDGQVGETYLGIFFVLLGTCIFVLAGGHHLAIGAFVSSVHCLPPGASILVQQTGIENTGTMFASMMTWAIFLALPVYFAGFLAELVLALLSRLLDNSPGIGLAGLSRPIVTQTVIIASLFLVYRIALGVLWEQLETFDICTGL